MQSAHETTAPARVRNHTLIAKLFHWGFVGVFVYALTKQLRNVGQLADPGLLQFEVVFAIGFLILLAARFVYMRLTRPTALPDTAHPAIRLMARVGHLAMYASLSMIAISGLMIGAVYTWGSENGLIMDMAVGLHEASVNAAYVSIGVHVVAAVFHRLKGDGIWSAMVPVWIEKPVN